MKSGNLLLLKACKGKTTENQLKKLEISLDDANNIGKYRSIKNELNIIYNHMTKVIRIRRKFEWNEHNNFFTNLENNEVRKIHLKNLLMMAWKPQTRHKSYKQFKKQVDKTTAEAKDFFNAIDAPKLSEDQVELFEEDLIKNDL